MNTLMDSWPRRHRITGDEYHRMAELGLLAPAARIELIEGEIIDMAPIGIGHNSAVTRLGDLLHRAAGERGLVQVQGVVRLDSFSEPQPDIAVLVRRADYYRQMYPSPAEVLLLIEVSDRTLRYDLDVKLPLYASQGIPEAWIVDLQQPVLHRFWSPGDGRYQQHSETDAPASMAVAGLPGVAVDLSGLFSDPVR